MQKSKPRKGLKSNPLQVQLPGGIILKRVPFKIVAYNDDGTPKLFEIQPAGATFGSDDIGACWLFADESWIRSPMLGRTAPAKCPHPPISRIGGDEFNPERCLKCGALADRNGALS